MIFITSFNYNFKKMVNKLKIPSINKFVELLLMYVNLFPYLSKNFSKTQVQYVKQACASVPYFYWRSFCKNRN